MSPMSRKCRSCYSANGLCIIFNTLQFTLVHKPDTELVISYYAVVDVHPDIQREETATAAKIINI